MLNIITINQLLLIVNKLVLMMASTYKPFRPNIKFHHYRRKKVTKT